MARTFAEETVETSGTTGTGAYSLQGAKGDYLPFSASFVTGDKPAYAVRNASNTKWELNRNAVYTAGSPATLARGVWKSSNGNAAVSWTVDDLPLTIYVPASSEAHEGIVTGWLAAARHALVRAGAVFSTYSDIAVRWDRYIATGDATAARLGHVDVAAGIYFQEDRRQWFAVGAANKIISATDIGGIFTQDNAAANRTFTLPAHGATGVGVGFKVGGLGLTANGAYGIVLTPAAGDGIDGGADGVTKTIPGGVRFDVEWDEPGDTWRVTYLNTAPASLSGRRQTVAAGPVSTAGLPTFLPSTSVNLNLTSQNISASARLVVSAANGWDYQARPNDRVAVRTTNLTWTGLTASRAAATPNFLYVTIDTNGALTTDFTILPPIYQYGGTPSTTNKQFTFNTSEMKGYLGNGTTAPEAFVVFVGEAATSGSAVTSTVAYAYNGMYESAFTATLPTPGTLVTANHNIGAHPRVKELIVECTTIDIAYAVGQQISSSSGLMSADALGVNVPIITTRNTASFGVLNGGSWYALYGDLTNRGALTAARWKYKLIADRGW